MGYVFFDLQAANVYTGLSTSNELVVKSFCTNFLCSLW